MENLLDWKHQPFILRVLKKNTLVLRGRFSFQKGCVYVGVGAGFVQRGVKYEKKKKQKQKNPQRIPLGQDRMQSMLQHYV